jgi:peptide-methionine (S)-S-oxide reductase
MSSRVLAISAGLALILGHSGVALGQPATGSVLVQRKGEATGEAAAYGIRVAMGLAGEATNPSPEKTGSAATVKKPTPKPPKIEKATFGGGCFWSMEAIFERIPGVKNVVSGFSGGTVAKPSYELVCTGQTGHAEVVRIEYDPDAISYEQLLKIFFSAHDPTTLNRQGEDVGTNYRSVIFYHDNAQRDAAQKMYTELMSAGVFANPIVTQLAPLTIFYPAEKYHQDYYRRHRTADYCQTVIAPKLMKLHLKVK